jgi:hypothetical protein
MTFNSGRYESNKKMIFTPLDAASYDDFEFVLFEFLPETPIIGSLGDRLRPKTILFNSKLYADSIFHIFDNLSQNENY